MSQSDYKKLRNGYLDNTKGYMEERYDESGIRIPSCCEIVPSTNKYNKNNEFLNAQGQFGIKIQRKSDPKCGYESCYPLPTRKPDASDCCKVNVTYKDGKVITTKSQKFDKFSDTAEVCVWFPDGKSKFWCGEDPGKKEGVTLRDFNASLDCIPVTIPVKQYACSQTKSNEYTTKEYDTYPLVKTNDATFNKLIDQQCAVRKVLVSTKTSKSKCS